MSWYTATDAFSEADADELRAMREKHGDHVGRPTRPVRRVPMARPRNCLIALALLIGAGLWEAFKEMEGETRWGCLSVRWSHEQERFR